MPRPVEIHLDIETSWEGSVTVVGFHSRSTGLVQLVGPEITPRRLLRELPRKGKLFTYNGHCFDLPRIRRHLGLELRERFDHVDLRYVCKNYGLTGGQKAIEYEIGLARDTDGIDGMEAMRLWRRYLHGNQAALGLLLRYNSEDVRGLVAIKQHLRQLGHQY